MHDLKPVASGTVSNSNASQKIVTPYEEFLDKNTLINPIIMVGMDMPHHFFKTIPNNMNPLITRARVIEKYNP